MEHAAAEFRAGLVRVPPPPGPDPLLAALIAKLPPSGTVWPAERRAAWLRMLWMALDVVYDAGEGAIEMPAFLPDASPKAGKPESRKTPVAAAPTPPDPPFVKMSPAFYIDREGIARRAGGERILPAELGGERIYDQRGEAGDLGAILWADDSTGVRGLTIDIGAA